MTKVLTKAPNRVYGNILITGDFFRVSHGSAGSWHWQQEHNVSWLREIVAGAFATCGSIEVSTMDHAALGIEADQFGPKPGHSSETWWVEQISKPVEPSLASALRAAVAGKVVIAFEIPDNIADVIAETALAVLHIQISPVRFSDDALLSVTTTHTALAEVVAHVRVSDRDLYWQLGIMRAQMGVLSKEKALDADGMALVVAQTPFDRSLIRNGSVHSLADYSDEIRMVADSHELTLISPHPYSSDKIIAGIEELVSIPGLRITVANCYRIMAAGVVDEVVSISSSVLSEAPYFGLQARGFDGYTPPQPPMIRAHSLGEEIAEAVAGLLGTDLPSLAGRNLLAGPVISRILGYSWGKDQIEQSRHLLPALTLRSLPQTLTPSDPAFSMALGHGWYTIEEWGVWCGPLGVLNIEGPEDRAEPILCILHLRTVDFGPASQPYQIWSDGINLARGLLLRDTPTQVVFEIPPPTRRGPVQLWILSPKSFRPSETQFGNPDTRLLGVAMSGYEVRPL